MEQEVSGSITISAVRVIHYSAARSLFPYSFCLHASYFLCVIKVIVRVIADDLDKSVQALGKYWGTLLVHTDAELGIDSEFTRPGILALLGKFKEEVESTGAFEDCKPFKWTK